MFVVILLEQHEVQETWTADSAAAELQQQQNFELILNDWPL